MTIERQTRYVYLLLSHIGLYKIGVSIDPVKRLKVIRKKKPNERIYLVHQFPADDAIRAESTLHAWFSSKRHSWDWFRLDLEDIDFIESITEYKDGQYLNGQ